MMHPLIILLISALLGITESAVTCSNPIGPCLNDYTCPGTTTCIGGECCADADIVVPGAPTTAPTPAPTPSTPAPAPTTAAPVPTAATPVTTVPSIPCVDNVNPQTRVSDCPTRSYLCNDATYYTLMTQQCPKTCNRCPGSPENPVNPVNPQPQPAPSSNCRDLVHYQTGVSDCPQRAYLCTNALYQSLMQVQCPKTCGFCT